MAGYSTVRTSHIKMEKTTELVFSIIYAVLGTALIVIGALEVSYDFVRIDTVNLPGVATAALGALEIWLARRSYKRYKVLKESVSRGV